MRKKDKIIKLNSLLLGESLKWSFGMLFIKISFIFRTSDDQNNRQSSSIYNGWEKGKKWFSNVGFEIFSIQRLENHLE